MIDTITRYLSSLSVQGDKLALLRVLSALGDRLSSQALGNAGLVIFAGASPLAKTGVTATAAMANGILLSIPAGASMAALSGTTLQNRFNVYVFYVDQSGVLTTIMGQEATTLAGVRFPQTPVGRAIVGFITVNPTSAAFVGGTTALDAAATNVVYVNTPGAFDPTVLVV